MYALEQTMRWYGPNDPVKLQDIRQAGCSGVVTALHDVPVGEMWSLKAINNLKSIIETQGLQWTVVESLPVHEDIKTRSGDCTLYIESYKKSLAHLAECGISVVTYNFMPILDWIRTDVEKKLDNGAEALYFNNTEYSIFDLCMLERPGADRDYSKEEIQNLQKQYQALSKSERQRIFTNVLLGLPGSDIPFTLDAIRELLATYEHIDRVQLKSNLISFLSEIALVADELGVLLAIHPDDPPYEVLGLPRILSTAEDIEDIISAVPNESNGLCFCTGSFGARLDNDIPSMIRKWGSRIYFLHLRNTKRDELGNFMEAEHLNGGTDMYEVMKEIILIMHSQQRCIPMRPDHGHKMLGDLEVSTYPGYSAIGRLKGLAELRGLELGIRKSLAT